MQKLLSRLFGKPNQVVYQTEQQCHLKLNLFARGFSLELAQSLSLALTGQWEKMTRYQREQAIANLAASRLAF